MPNNDEFTIGKKVNKQELEVESSQINIKGRISIDDFYSLMVEDWRNTKSKDYEVYLQQGQISANILYKVLGLNNFEQPSEEDKKRIGSWKDKWNEEAEKFLRTDISKKDDICFAVGTLTAIFMSDKRAQLFNEVLKKATLSHLDTVISEKCADKIVELDEMLAIINTAKELGLYDKYQEKETSIYIKESIKNKSSIIESIYDAFKKEANEYIELNPKANVIDNETNRRNLYTKYLRLLEIEYAIDGNEMPSNEKKLKNNFNEILKVSGINLIGPRENFVNTFLNDFKKSHDLSQNVSPDDYYGLRANAIACGLTDTEWQSIAKENNIKLKEIKNSNDQKKIDNLQSELEKMKKEKAKQKQRTPEQIKKRKRRITAWTIILIILAIIGGMYHKEIYEYVKTEQYKEDISNLKQNISNSYNNWKVERAEKKQQKEIEKQEEAARKEAERLKQEEEARIKAEQEAEQRKLEEAAKAEQEKKDAAERAEREKKEAEERAEREKIEAAERAEREAREAEERRIREAEEERVRHEKEMSKKYKVGKMGQAGGCVFYDKGAYSDGWRFLEICPSNLGECYWAPDEYYDTKLTTLRGGLGNGDQNTQVIVHNYGMNTAAGIASSYSGGGYSDWYLPNRDEMILCYKTLGKKYYGKAKKIPGWDPVRKGFLGIFGDSLSFWTSEMGSYGEAYYINCHGKFAGDDLATEFYPTTTLGIFDTHRACQVRAIRKF